MALEQATYGLNQSAIAPGAYMLPQDTRLIESGQDAVRWAVPAFVVKALGPGGGGMLTYLAALKNIPISLYEAARIDGAEGPSGSSFHRHICR